MKKQVKSIIPLFLLMMYLSSPLLSDGETPTPGEIEKDTIFINEVPGPSGTISDSLVNYLDYKSVNDWATTLKMTAIPDSLPVTDGVAFFLACPHIEIPVSGFNKDGKYSIYIDFVRYKNREKTIDSLLKIFIQDKYGNREPVATIEYSFLFKNKIFETEIPFNLSYTGNITIIIQEYSGRPGYWGIWDIIVSSKSIEEIGKLNIDNRPEIKKNDPKIFK